MENEDVRRRIAELESMPRVLVGSDQGTHGSPDTYDVWETIDGERYATYKFGNSNGSRCTVRGATSETSGRIVWFHAAIGELARRQAELKVLRKQLRGPAKKVAPDYVEHHVNRDDSVTLYFDHRVDCQRYIDAKLGETSGIRAQFDERRQLWFYRQHA